ncbi:hypothetical protein EVC08_054 [Rhizobium phage RHph_N65]|nr:hypothetical protein EVC08_054 [Rhizobium phage RHph_N65]
MAKTFDPRFEAYAHFGNAGEPMLTERVDLRLRPTSFANYQALVQGHWRWVRTDINDRAFVIVQGERVHVQITRNEA